MYIRIILRSNDFNWYLSPLNYGNGRSRPPDAPTERSTRESAHLTMANQLKQLNLVIEIGF